jgi:hypothetical protein
MHRIENTIFIAAPRPAVPFSKHSSNLHFATLTVLTP